jgi:hypothetical protein
MPSCIPPIGSGIQKLDNNLLTLDKGIFVISTLLLKACHKKQENFSATLQPLTRKDFAVDQITLEYFEKLGCGR